MSVRQVPAVSEKPRILHVSADFPDPIAEFKTPVIRSLVDLTSDVLEHDVISLNRHSLSIVEFGKYLLDSSSLEVKSQIFTYGRTLVYRAPPKGVFHATILRQLGDWVARTQPSVGCPDLMIGHKLAIEGIAVRRASRLLGIPYAVCIQGDTDTKILTARRDLHGELAKVFHEAEVVFPFAPWALHQYERRLGRRSGPTVMLPCPTDLDVPMAPSPQGNGYISVFHLKNYQRKNLATMVSAMALLIADQPAASLHIVGGGSEVQFARCRAIAKEIPNIKFEGPLDRSAVRERLNKATGFVLPSLRESFGLVFIEALFAGLPIIYPKGTAIDGYFDGASFALGVEARNSDALATAMRFVSKHESRLKKDLLQWQRSDHAKRFMRQSIGYTFAEGLKHCLRK